MLETRIGEMLETGARKNCGDFCTCFFDHFGEKERYDGARSES